MGGTLVQAAGGNTGSATSPTSMTCAFGAASVTGHTLLLACASDNVMSDPAGWTRDKFIDNTDETVLFRKTSAGETSFNITIAGPTSWGLLEYAETLTPDQSATGSGTSASASTGTTATLAQVGDVGVAAFGLGGTGRGSDTFSAETNSYVEQITDQGTSNAGSQVLLGLATNDNLGSTSGTSSVATIGSGSQNWAALVVAYTVTGGAAPAAGLGPYRPGRTWRRRFKHQQRLFPSAAAITALTGDVSATVTETDTVTAVVGKVGAVTATVTSGSTVTAVVGVVGSVTATVTSGSTVTAAVGDVGAVSATVTCGSTVTAVVGAVGAVTATVVCGSTVTGSTVSGLIGTVNVTVTSTSTVTAVVGKVAAVTAAVASGSTVTAFTALTGAVTATVASGSTVTAVVGKIGTVTSTVTAGSTVTPVLLGAVIDVTGRVTIAQTAVSVAAGSSTAGGATAIDSTEDGRASVA